MNKNHIFSEHKYMKQVAWAYSLILGFWVLIQSGLPYTLFANIKLNENAWAELLVGWFLTGTSAWLLYLLLIKYQSLVNSDPLTGLPNRHLFQDRIIQAIAYADRTNQLIAIAYIDLDNFKLINDSLGHTAGDHLLKNIADKLQAVIRPIDTVARLGGDEFVLILYDLPDEGSLSQEIDRINQVFSAPFFVGKNEIFVSYSAGFSLYPQDGKNAEVLLMNADVAMYKAKEQSGNSFQFYAPEMHAKINDRLLIESSMRHALEAGEFYLMYQPKIDLQSKQVIGMEALIRWNHPVFGIILPAKFIELAENTGLIVSIGEWAVRTACQQLNEFNKDALKKLSVAVNLSGRQLKDANFILVINKILKEVGTSPDLLELELTESVLMDDSEAFITILDQLKNTGINLSIDDFGTGYSSLSYLKRFPMDKLKIDQSFIKDISLGGGDATIVKAIIYLGHSLNLKVVAEGIETQEQMDFLALHGCDEGQGFCVGKPMLAADFKIFVEQYQF